MSLSYAHRNCPQQQHIKSPGNKMVISPISAPSNNGSIFSRNSDSLDDVLSTETNLTSTNDLYYTNAKHYADAKISRAGSGSLSSLSSLSKTGPQKITISNLPKVNTHTKSKKGFKTDSWYFEGPSKLIKVSTSGQLISEIGEEFSDDDDDDLDFEFVTRDSLKSPSLRTKTYNRRFLDFDISISDNIAVPQQKPPETPLKDDRATQEATTGSSANSHLPFSNYTKSINFDFSMVNESFNKAVSAQQHLYNEITMSRSNTLRQLLSQRPSSHWQAEHFNGDLIEGYCEAESISASTPQNQFYAKGNRPSSTTSLSQPAEITTTISSSRFRKSISLHKKTLSNNCGNRVSMPINSDNKVSSYSSDPSLKRKLSMNLLSRTASRFSSSNDTSSILSHTPSSHSSNSSSKKTVVSGSHTSTRISRSTPKEPKLEPKYHKTAFSNIFITKKDIEKQKRQLTVLNNNESSSAKHESHRISASNSSGLRLSMSSSPLRPIFDSDTFSMNSGAAGPRFRDSLLHEKTNSRRSVRKSFGKFFKS